MCLRYAPVEATSLAIDETTNLASSSLINAQIINFKVYIADMSTASSIFRVGVLNYFTDNLYSEHVATYVPTLLRLGGRL